MRGSYRFIISDLCDRTSHLANRTVQFPHDRRCTILCRAIFNFDWCSTILSHDELLLACAPPTANLLPRQRPCGSPYGVWRLGGRFQLRKAGVAVEIDLFLPFVLLVTGSDPDPPWPRQPVRIVHRTGHASPPTHGVAPVEIAAAIAPAVCPSLGDRGLIRRAIFVVGRGNGH